MLDAARLWRQQKGNTRTERVLASAFDVLAASEEVLGEVYACSALQPAA